MSNTMYPEMEGMPVSDFMSMLRAACLQNHNVSYTENGAKVFGSTGSALLDLNFSLAELRRCDPEEIIRRFIPAMEEDPILAMKWLFYCRDIREGMGEKNTFKVIIQALARAIPEKIRHLVSLIPEYGSWNDMWVLFDTPLEGDVLRVVSDQFSTDMQSLHGGKSVSLMGKWLPSINGTSKESRKHGMKICRYLGLKPVVYRKSLSKLRSAIDVVEKKMTANEWDKINYPGVPSRANILYAKAFLRHDKERREKFLQDVLEGKAKINSGVLFPHDIIGKLMHGGSYTKEDFDFIEGMWKNLPKVPNMKKTLVVSDGSRSMLHHVQAGSSIRSLDIAIGLSIYFSQFLDGPFKNRFITFSEHPQMVDLSSAQTLLQKVEIMERYQEIANTNIQAVFELILQVWSKSGMNPDIMPDNILIVSDMQFDSCVVDNNGSRYDINPNLFGYIGEKYQELGAKLPRCCFWNTRGAVADGIPMIKNELGVALMSGFSINNAKLIMSAKLDPYEALVDVLNSERYEAVTLDL